VTFEERADLVEIGVCNVSDHGFAAGRVDASAADELAEPDEGPEATVRHTVQVTTGTLLRVPA
jgi:hypothetical protein